MHLFDIDIPGEIHFRESNVLSPGNEPIAFDTGELQLIQQNLNKGYIGDRSFFSCGEVFFFPKVFLKPMESPYQTKKNTLKCIIILFCTHIDVFFFNCDMATAILVVYKMYNGCSSDLHSKLYSKSK